MVKKYKIAVCGASKIHLCGGGVKEKAIELGREIIKNNCILLTGATTGVADYAAKGAKQKKGTTIGLSPAISFKDHTKRYRLPIENMDIVLYTGAGYSGRNPLLTRASDGVIVVCGGFGTLNEFTAAFEDEKPIGVLEGTSGVADYARTLVKELHQSSKKIVFDKNPSVLVKKLIKLIEKDNK